jgi:hypothetical protein
VLQTALAKMAKARFSRSEEQELFGFIQGN